VVVLLQLKRWALLLKYWNIVAPLQGAITSCPGDGCYPSFCCMTPLGSCKANALKGQNIKAWG